MTHSNTNTHTHTHLHVSMHATHTHTRNNMYKTHAHTEIHINTHKYTYIHKARMHKVVHTGMHVCSCATSTNVHLRRAGRWAGGGRRECVWARRYVGGRSSQQGGYVRGGQGGGNKLRTPNNHCVLPTQGGETHSLTHSLAPCSVRIDHAYTISIMDVCMCMC